MKQKRMPLLWIILQILLFFFLLSACKGKDSRSVSQPLNSGGINTPTGPAWRSLALLKTGGNPLWFELRPDGPGLIDSPLAASLTPYVPWPHARYITCIQAWDGFLVMPVNRDGFLVLGPAAQSTGKNTDVLLYRAASGRVWDPYTTESFFIWDDKPAVLLYRNDFFAELSVPPLGCQVFILDKTSAVPLAVSVPALESFPPGGPWETELVHRGSDGFWYYRMREKGKIQNETSYFRTANLAKAGVKISSSDWRTSIRPEENSAQGTENGFGSFSLPTLPEGFIYTGAAFLGDVIAASWEEQEEAGIGAAGFMVMSALFNDR